MKHIIDKNGETRIIDHVLVWDSVDEITRAVVAGVNRKGVPNYISSFQDPFKVKRERSARNRYASGTGDSMGENVSRSAWLGRNDLRGWDQLVKMIESPWDEGMKALEEMKKAVEHLEFAVPHSIKRRSCWDEEAGSGDFDYDRYSSSVAPWRSVSKRDMTGQQFVTLCVSTASHCHACSYQACQYSIVNAKSFIWSGLTALVTAQKLEEQGYSVEILSCSPGRESFAEFREGGGKPHEDKSESWIDGKFGKNSGGRYHLSPDGFMQNMTNAVWVKKADQLVDENAMIASISPWFFRTVVFGLYTLVPNTICDEFLGKVDRIRKHNIEKITQDDRVIPIEEIWTKESAVQKVSQILKQFSDEPDPLVDLSISDHLSEKFYVK